MKRILQRFATFALLAAAGAAAAEQPSAPAPAPAQGSPQPQQPPAPPLKLRLDELERRPSITFAPRDDKKQDAAQNLPGLGGKPSKSMGESDPSKVIPVTNDNIE
jgi:hypothetical protein